MPARSLAVVIAVLATTAIAPASAQTPAEPDSAWRAALARLTPGSTVRVHNRERGSIEGRVLDAPGPTLTLDVDAMPMEFSTATLDSLWVRGTAAKTGATAGAVSGAVVGGLLGYVAFGVGHIDCEYSCGGATQTVLAGAVAGAILGAAVGALIGSFTPKWHRQVP